MPVDPDDLAAAALRRDGKLSEDADASDRDNYTTLRRVVTIGRSIDDTDRDLHDPPAGLWDRIAAEAFDAPGGSAEAPEPAPAPEAGPVTGSAGGAEVIDLSAARAKRRNAILAVAAAVALIAGVAGFALTRDTAPAQELVASADLELLAGGGSGSAELVQRDDGLHLVVDVSDLEPAEGADFFELWLLTPDGTEPQSMTKFDESSGTIDVVVPEGMDPTQFPVVDISEELDDGDDTHSGLSILRGSLA